jgi:predicted dehydrogenase
MNPLPRRKFLSLSTKSGLALGAALGRSELAHALSRPAGPFKIRIGQIGVGHAHASGKMETIRRSEDYELVGVVELDPARRAAAEKSAIYAGVPWMTEEQLLNAPGLRAVAVETTVKDLIPTAARCVAAGKHVHVDKPAGESLAAFRALLDDAARRKLVVQMGYMLRYNPAFALCFQMVRDGWLGDVFSIDAVMSKLMRVAERAPLLPYRGGAMFELGCHVIDAVVSVLGRPEKVTPYNRVLATDGDPWPDNQLAVLEYPTATATVRSSLGEVDGGPRRQFVVCGKRGTFDIRPIEPPAARLALDEPHDATYHKGYQDVKFPAMTGRYDGDFADLAKVIRGDKAYAFTAEHDLAVHETVLRASGLPVA